MKFLFLRKFHLGVSEVLWLLVSLSLFSLCPNHPPSADPSLAGYVHPCNDAAEGYIIISHRNENCCLLLSRFISSLLFLPCSCHRDTYLASCVCVRGFSVLTVSVCKNSRLSGFISLFHLTFESNRVNSLNQTLSWPNLSVYLSACHNGHLVYLLTFTMSQVAKWVLIRLKLVFYRSLVISLGRAEGRFTPNIFKNSLLTYR